MASQNDCGTRPQVIDSKWWPGTGSNRRRRPFQGRLASELSGLESADIIETISLLPSSN
ncbi:MAG: hypothetical protein JWO80_3993 [Bryobacterales bacterium]|jgi:hypothetical protein|nr:hypothetical protein [Bryobacterales bacterium]